MTKLPALTSSARLPTGEPDVTPVFDTSIRLPISGGFDEHRAIDCIAAFFSKMLHKLKQKFNREWAETIVQQKLREGSLDLTREAIQEAEAGDEVFDAA